MISSIARAGGSPATRIFVLTFLLTLAATTGAHAVGATFLDNLDSFNPARWQESDGWTNGGVFNCGWRADHLKFPASMMTLRLDNTGCPGKCSGKPFASGQYQTLDVYGYGRFEARMKAAKGSGILTSFFIFNQTPWHEVDLEILGVDTTQLQMNYFTDGVGGHETVLHLGFDASADFHNYTIVWAVGSIQWYVDGVLIHVETGDRGPLPTVPGKIFANLWTGIGLDGWLGPFTYSGPLTASFDRIQYTQP